MHRAEKVKKVTMELIIFSGIQCAGKSSYYRQHFSATHAYVNLDALKSRKRESDTFFTFIDELRPVVVDNTNPLCQDRARYISLAKIKGYRVIGYQFKVPLTIALQRSVSRKSQKEIPAFIIRNTMKKLQPLVFEEGFDQIFEVGVSGEATLIVNSI